MGYDLPAAIGAAFAGAGRVAGTPEPDAWSASPATAASR